MAIRIDPVLVGVRALLMLPGSAGSRQSTAEALRHSGVELHVEYREDRVRRMLERQSIDVVISAGLSPHPDVAAFCQWARRIDPDVIIIGVAAASDLTSRVMALSSGADDCVSEDVHPLELAARMRAVQRRLRTARPVERRDEVQTEFGPYRLHPASATVTANGQRVPVTEAEYTVLWALMRRGGRAVSRETLQRELHGQPRREGQRSIDVLVMRLRRKLGRRADGGDYIGTARGVGYRFVGDAASHDA